MDPKAICGLLAEPERLHVFSSIVMGASDVTTIAERCDLSLSATARALGRLTDGGLVTTDRDGCLAASPEVFKQAVRQAHVPSRSGGSTMILGAMAYCWRSSGTKDCR
jgi:hypothetical protein